jgi:integrase
MGRSAGPPVPYLRGGIYWCRFTVAGVRYFESTGEGDLRAAHASAARLHAKAVLEAGGERGPRRRRPVDPHDLGALTSRYLAHARSLGKDPDYIDSQELHWRAHFMQLDEQGEPTRWRRLEEINARSIAKYQVERSGKVGTVTLYKELVSLSRFLKWCKREGLLEQLPEFERPRQETDYEVPNLAPDQVQAFLGALPGRAEHPKRMPVREWATWCWAMALRKTEASAILWSDVDLESRRLVVRKEIDKARTRWVLPLTDEAHAVLVEEAKRPHGPRDRIFTLRDVRGSFEKACAALKLPGVTPHHLRHFRITEWANSTRRLAAVQFMARHLSIATTARYVRSRTEAAEEMLVEMRAANSDTKRARIPIQKPPKKAAKRANSRR